MPSRDRTRRVVGVINTNDDLVVVLRDALLAVGLQVVTGHIRDIKAGTLDFTAFLAAHDPDLVIYDIAVPYEGNWTFFNTLRQLPEARSRKFLITTVNKLVMEDRVGPTDAVEIRGGHADDLDPVVDAVRKQLGLPGD